MNTKSNMSLVFYCIKNKGLFYTIKKVNTAIYKRIFKKNLFEYNEEGYKKWIKENEPTLEEIELQKKHIFNINPKISIVVPMYNTNIVFFKQLIDSIKQQTYSNWELCLADGSKSKNNEFLEIINKDEKIKYKFLNENKGISENSNEAIKMATGDYIALLDHDDLLPKFCLYEVVNTINNNPNVEFIYTDEDKIENDDKIRFQAYFKSDFQIDTLRSNNYITHLSVFKKELLDKIGGFRKNYDGAQDYDLILRATENTNNIVHIPKVLYHWRVSPNSTAILTESKPYAYEAGKRAILDHLKRQNLDAIVKESNDIKGVYEVEYIVKDNPLVSIVITDKDNLLNIKKNVNKIIDNTSYRNYEIVIIKNILDDEIRKKDEYKTLKNNNKIKLFIYHDKENNYSKIINETLRKLESKYIINLSGNVKNINSDWIEKLIGFENRKDVGIVGSRIYYKNRNLKHAGMEIDSNGKLINIYENLKKGKHAYFGKECITRDVDGVLPDCLCIEKEVLENCDYLNEEYENENDSYLDLCIKVKSKGYLIVYNPYVEIIEN